MGGAISKSTPTIPTQSESIDTPSHGHGNGGQQGKSSDESQNQTVNNSSHVHRDHDPEKTQPSQSRQMAYVYIFYGTNTGTAEQFSYNLKSSFHSKGIVSRVINLDEFTPKMLLSCSLAIFLVATYGDGEPTESAQDFSEWLSNKENEVSTNYLSNLHFLVFGLGNRTYEFFNRMGKMTHLGLEKLGGHALHPLAEGDADDDIERDYENWRDDIIPLVQNYLVEKKIPLLPSPTTPKFQN